MATELKFSLVTSLEAAAAKAGLTLVSATQGTGLNGRPTAVFELALPGNQAAARSLRRGTSSLLSGASNALALRPSSGWPMRRSHVAWLHNAARSDGGLKPRIVMQMAARAARVPRA